MSGVTVIQRLALSPHSNRVSDCILGCVGPFSVELTCSPLSGFPYHKVHVQEAPGLPPQQDSGYQWEISGLIKVSITDMVLFLLFAPFDRFCTLNKP